MFVRRLGEEDLEALWGLRLQALREMPEAFGSTYEETLARGKQPLLRRLRAGDEICYLGAFAEDLVGMVGFIRESGAKERHKGHLISLYVRPESRGQGVGKALVRALIVHARLMADLEQVLLTVVTSVEPARRLYLALGFQVYGTAPQALASGGQYWDEDLMVLHLR
jgi:ribosomal protein S18 acetylase RimI-like enzyme